uniref:Uncharacterized protein n=1 Tax=Romanomermis culicivorax TaxID=13658 RepID=A0A915JQ49_ROMCU
MLSKKALSYLGILACYGLLPDTSQQTYDNFFTAIQNAIIQLCGDQGNIQFFVLDFKMVAHLAVQNVFQNIKTKGSLFHFEQCLTHSIQRQGLMPLYEVQNSELKKWIGLVKALAYMPPDLVIETWQKWLINPLDRSIGQNLLQFQEFIAYFEKFNCDVPAAIV